MIAIGCDHGGFILKEEIKKHLKQKGLKVKDFGTYSKESVDYPKYALKVANSVVNKESECGILCCGTGIGISIAANKVNGIRAAVATNVFSARACKEHNDANILCIGERVTGTGLALLMVDEWLNSTFKGGRHQNRIDQILSIECCKK